MVSYVDSNLFYGCWNLKLFTFTDDSQCSRISEYSFYGTDLTEIRFPRGITEISQFAFACCENLSKIIFHPSGKLNILHNFAFCNSPIHEICAGSTNKDIIMHLIDYYTNISITIVNEAQYNSLNVVKDIGNRVNSKVICLQNEVNDLKESIISLQNENPIINELRSQIKSLESEKKKLHSKKKSNHKLKKKSEELQKRINELESENKTLKENKQRVQVVEGSCDAYLSNYILDLTKFEDVSQIGRGRRGDVFLVKNIETGQLLAKKVYGKNDMQEDDGMKFTRECDISCSIRNPCIYRFAGFCLPSSQSPASIFFEYMEGGTLQEIIDSRPSEWTSTRKAICVIEIVIGMKHLHEQGIIHRDLKPSNILCTKSLNFKISDFSESIFCDLGITMTGGVGTILFMSPEILNDDPYDSKTDVFSFGSILFNIVTGSTPKVKLSDIMRGKRAPIPEDVTPLVQEIIAKCWHQDPSDRPSFNEILCLLERNDFKIFEDVDSSVVLEKFESLNVK